MSHTFRLFFSDFSFKHTEDEAISWRLKMKIEIMQTELNIIILGAYIKRSLGLSTAGRLQLTRLGP